MTNGGASADGDPVGTLPRRRSGASIVAGLGPPRRRDPGPLNRPVVRRSRDRLALRGTLDARRARRPVRAAALLAQEVDGGVGALGGLILDKSATVRRRLPAPL